MPSSDRTKERRHRLVAVAVLLALGLVAAACWGGEEDADEGGGGTSAVDGGGAGADGGSDGAEDGAGTDPGDEVDPGAEGAEPAEGGSDGAGDAEAAGPCIGAADGIDTEVGAPVGLVEEVPSSRVELNCVEVIGDEPIPERALLGSDGQGVVRFRLEPRETACKMLAGSRVRARPDDGVILRLLGGVLLCSVEGGTDDRLEVTIDGEVREIELEPRTEVLLLTTGEDPSILVNQGALVIPFEQLACSAIVGPGQRLELDPSGRPTATTLDAADIDASVRAEMASIDWEVADPAGTEVLTGLADLLASGRVGLAVGDPTSAGASTRAPDVEAARSPERAEVVEALTRVDLAAVDAARFDIVATEPLEPADALDLDRLELDGIDLDALGPTAGGSLAVAPGSSTVDPDPDTGASPPVEAVALEVLIDPDGERWSVVVPRSEQALVDELGERIDASLWTGALGRSYVAAFEAEPPYHLMLPDLVGDDEQVC